VWVTGQALAALRRKAFPLATVARRSRTGTSRSSSSAARRSSRARRRAGEESPAKSGAAGRADRAADEALGQLGTRRASGERPPGAEGSEEGLSAWVLAGAGVATLLLLGLLRRFLRRRRPASP
jgi:hypothetical protein